MLSNSFSSHLDVTQVPVAHVSQNPNRTKPAAQRKLFEWVAQPRGLGAVQKALGGTPVHKRPKKSPKDEKYSVCRVLYTVIHNFGMPPTENPHCRKGFLVDT